MLLEEPQQLEAYILKTKDKYVIFFFFSVMEKSHFYFQLKQIYLTNKICENVLLAYKAAAEGWGEVEIYIKVGKGCGSSKRTRKRLRVCNIRNLPDQDACTAGQPVSSRIDFRGNFPVVGSMTLHQTKAFTFYVHQTFLSGSCVNGGPSTWRAQVKWKQRFSSMKLHVTTCHWLESTVTAAT